MSYIFIVNLFRYLNVNTISYKFSQTLDWLTPQSTRWTLNLGGGSICRVVTAAAAAALLQQSYPSPVPSPEAAPQAAATGSAPESRLLAQPQPASLLAGCTAPALPQATATVAGRMLLVPWWVRWVRLVGRTGLSPYRLLVWPHSSGTFGSPPRTFRLLALVPLPSFIPHVSVFSISTSLSMQDGSMLGGNVSSEHGRCLRPGMSARVTVPISCASPSSVALVRLSSCSPSISVDCQSRPWPTDSWWSSGATTVYLTCASLLFLYVRYFCWFMCGFCLSRAMILGFLFLHTQDLWHAIPDLLVSSCFPLVPCSDLWYD
jgi:hypothetical protein